MFKYNPPAKVLSKMTVSEQHAYGMQQSFLLSMLSQQLIERLIRGLPSKLVVLTGASCSGKSSLAKQLTQLDDNMVHIDGDDIVRQTIYCYLQNNFPEQCAELYQSLGEDVAYYVFCSPQRDLFFKKLLAAHKAINVNSLTYLQNELIKQSDQLKQSITAALLQRIKNYMLFGKVVVLDLVIDNKGLQPFQELSPIILTIYCPIRKLTEHIIERNKQAIHTQQPRLWREPVQPFLQLGQFFSQDYFLPATYMLEKISTSHMLEEIETVLATFGEAIDLENTFNVEQMLDALIKSLHLNASTMNKLYVKEFSHAILKAENLDAHQLAIIVYRYLLYTKYYYKQPKTVPYDFLATFNFSPRLIILDGMATAGKTTIARALTAINPATVLIGRSDKQRKLLREKMPSSLRKENIIGDNIFAFAQYNSHPGFKNAFHKALPLNTEYLDQVDLFCRTMQQTIFMEEEQVTAKKSQKYLSAGFTVVLDNLINKRELGAFSDLNPLLVLVYCPFASLLEHIKARYKEAVNKNRPLKWRDPFRVYKVYPIFFGSENKYNLSSSLECLKKTDVVNTLERLFSEFNSQEFGEEKENYINSIIQKLGLDRSDTVEIYPQLTRHHLILNTNNTAESNAQLLVTR